MQIGEFAKICNTKISVLRHYDKEGLLVPDYIDRLTGYRYYSNGQIEVFARIAALKKAGFSLPEIRDILSENKSSAEILALFEKKKTELEKMFLNLKEAENMMFFNDPMIYVNFIETANGITARTSKIDANYFNHACELLDNAVRFQGYQRISNHMTYGEPMSDYIEVVCDVVKLTEHETWPHDDIDLPFENDESVIGKWEILGEFAVKEDFYSEGPAVSDDSRITTIYFLPGGERYWCYGWTKGKLLFQNGEMSTVNDFTVEEFDGDLHMFVNLKSYDYRHGGATTVLVLRQIDNKPYTADEIAKRDNTDRKFVSDQRILGKWKAFDFCRTKEAFDPERQSDRRLFFTDVEFKPDGEMTSYYNYGETKIDSRDMQEWTHGYILRKYNGTACAYELQTINGVEYLFIEWKSGDYIWGGSDPTYYVFVRQDDHSLRR